MKLTRKEIRDILKLVEPGEPIPLIQFQFRLIPPTQEDIEWAKSLVIS